MLRLTINPHSPAGPLWLVWIDESGMTLLAEVI